MSDKVRKLKEEMIQIYGLKCWINELWIPNKNCVEKNIIDIYIKKLQKFEDTIAYLCDNYEKMQKGAAKGSFFTVLLCSPESPFSKVVYCFILNHSMHCCALCIDPCKILKNPVRNRIWKTFFK